MSISCRSLFLQLYPIRFFVPRTEPLMGCKSHVYWAQKSKELTGNFFKISVHFMSTLKDSAWNLTIIVIIKSIINASHLYYYCRFLIEYISALWCINFIYIKGSILIIIFFILWVCYWVIYPPLLFVFTASVAVLWSNPYVHLCGLHTGKNTNALLPLLSRRQDCTRRLQ